ncbi:MAG: Efflux transporter, RND family, MFP subunit, partial [Candidatus Roizmanbacteria bacterium GW2011_GWA1_41_13]
QYVSISLPVGFADTNSIIPFIPLESVFQSQDESLVFVNESGTARARKVTLGYVTGRFVEVTDGLQDEDVVLLDRTLIEGDRVTVKSL